MTKYACGHNTPFVFISKKNFAKEMLIYEDWKVVTGFLGDKSQCIQCFYKSLTPNQIAGYNKRVKEFEDWKKKQKEAKKQAGEKK